MYTYILRDIIKTRKLLHSEVSMNTEKLLNIKEETIRTLGEFKLLPHIHPLERRIVLRNYHVINPLRIEEYIARDGYFALEKSLLHNPEYTLNEVIQSNLRGFGGVGFPTGLKWRYARGYPSTEKYIICNADEGEPGTFMDKHIMEGDPHSVLEGIIIAGYTIGAHMGYIYIRMEYPESIKIIQKAIEDAYSYNLLGSTILESNFSFDIEVRVGAGAFICGEETSLIESIEGNRGESRNKPPFPAEFGLFQRPTVVNNVETLANIPQIILNGGAWYQTLGTEKSSGTKVFSLSGKINNPGIYEVEMGITLKDLVESLGGGMKPGSTLHFIVSGGPSGGFLTSEHLDVPVDFDSLVEYGSIMGSGGLIVCDQHDDILDILQVFMKFNEEESCGKCTPCREGTSIMVDYLESFQQKKATKQTLIDMKKLGKMMQKASLCGLGQAAPNPVFSALRYFQNKFEETLKDGE